MSEDQWLETIKRMQKKAPELITDEKVILLAAYFHRREFTLAKIFYGRCRLCHLESSGGTPPPDSTKQLDGLIALANEEFGESLQIKDVNSLLSTHIERQKNDMQLYEDKCNICHNDELPIKADSDHEKSVKRTRSEWISFIASLQGLEMTKEIQNTINMHIENHLAKH